MEVEVIILHEINQTHNVKFHMISFILESLKGYLIFVESGMIITGFWGH
jgi:hypothetical protein